MASFFFFETKGVYSTLRNKPHSKPRTIGPGEARKQTRELIKQPHLGTGTVPLDVEMNPHTKQGIEHPHLVKLLKSLGSLRQMRPLEPRRVEPGRALVIHEKLPQLSFHNMLRPIFIAEAKGVPIQPRKPSDRSPKERPHVAAFLQLPGQGRAKKALLPG
jgi:hypothetical protein